METATGASHDRGQLGMPASTVHAVLKRCRLNRLSHIDRVTGEPARRYERERPGELIHVDVTTLGNIPDGGGWAYKKLYTSEAVRRAALSGWLDQYNHHRPHSALGGQPPITRLDNLAGHHNSRSSMVTDSMKSRSANASPPIPTRSIASMVSMTSMPLSTCPKVLRILSVR